MKKIFTLLVLALTMFSMAYAGDYKFDFSSKIPSPWKSNPSPYGFETTNNKRGAQFTSSTVLSLNGVKGLTKIVIVCSANAGGSITALLGKETFGKSLTFSKIASAEKTISGTSADGNLNIAVTPSSKSIWIKSITITCDEYSGASTGDDEDDEDGDFSWEPTTKSTKNYTFTSCSSQTAEYLGQSYAYIGLEGEDAFAELYLFGEPNDETIIAPGVYTIDDSYEEGTALKSEGYDEEYEEDIPCYIGTDFEGDYYNASYYLASGTITVTKVSEGVKIEIDAVSHYGSTIKGTYIGKPETTGSDDEDEDYPYEETTPTTANFTFEEAYFEYDCLESGIEFTSIYLEEDENTAELWLFGKRNEATIMEPGTYTFSTMAEDGTVLVSGGYDDENGAYPSYIALGVSGQTCEGFYYLVEGTVTISAVSQGVKIVINAKSFYGSTITATYIGKPVNETAIETVNANPSIKQGKYIQNGRLVIQKGDRRYNAAGIGVR